MDSTRNYGRYLRSAIECDAGVSDSKGTHNQTGRGSDAKNGTHNRVDLGGLWFRVRHEVRLVGHLLPQSIPTTTHGLILNMDITNSPPAAVRSQRNVVAKDYQR
ncbi:hypothetical protein N7452_009785 [Penicillium brevicompactum]|uniref:Uncharacterized protein n=1 Tax=Penicillium brevicompactum TaxID=5074 RepID=A0A9W9Q9I7_PENBR|nr:hypothetical protein N7452_009785 [Penicillium brevicompactum]